MNKKRILILLALFLVLKIPQFVMLPDFDTGIYATDAVMVNQGKKLYVDVWTQKPPGLIMIFASVFLIAGSSLLSLKILGLFYMALNCVALFFLVRYLFDRDAAFYSLLLFMMASFYLAISLDGLDSEYFFLLPVLWGSLLFLKGIDKKSFWHVLTGGFVMGFAFFIKQVVFWNILALIFYVLVLAWKEKRYFSYIKFLFYLAAGILLFQLIWMAYFFLNGTFTDMMNNAFLFNLKYIQGSFRLSGYLSQVAVSFGKIFAGIFLIWIMGIFKFFNLLNRVKKNNHLFLICFFLFSFVGILTGMRFFGHYFVQVLPGICILAGLNMKDLIRENRILGRGIETGIRKKRAYVMTILVLSVLVYGLFQGYYLSKYVTDNPYYRIRAISKFIKSKTGKSDSIYVWGFPPSLYFLSGRNCPVRFCFLPIPLPDPDPRIEIYSQLKKTMPRIIVKSQASSRIKFPDLEKILNNEYHLIKQYQVVDLHRKSEAAFMQVFFRKNDDIH